MQISVEKTSDLGREIKLLIPANKLNELITTKINKLSKTIKLNGFRPGRVPIKLMQDKYGADVRREALNEVVDNSLQQAIKDNNLEPIGDIEVKKINNTDDNNTNDIECIFSLEVYPDIKLNNDFSTIEVSNLKTVISDDDVTKGLELVRKKLAKKIDITNRKAQLGDILTVDFVGTIDGKEFPGGKDTDAIVEIGSEKFIDGFESGLIGANLNDEVTLDLEFPKDYAEESLAGKRVLFTIKIKKIQENQLAEINEDLAKSLGVVDNKIDGINDAIKANIEEYTTQLAKDKERDQLIEQLLKNYPIIIPGKLLEKEQQHLEKLFKDRNREQGITINQLSDSAKNEVITQAKKNVHLSLLLQEVIKINELKLDENLVQYKLQEIQYLLGNKPHSNKYKNIYNNMKNSIINSMLTNLALNFIMERVTKVEKTVTFDELNKTS